MNRQMVYVGESDSVRSRLIAHDGDRQKQFFTRVCMLVSKDENLTKAHGRYLESRLINGIRTAGRARLVNGTDPMFRGLPEAEIADMDGFLDQVEVLLPVLGFDLFCPPGCDERERQRSSAAETVFMADSGKARARAVERAGEFAILPGSTALRRETASIPVSVREKRSALREQGALVDDTDPDLYRFDIDVGFTSPSAASGTVIGRADNGVQTWRVEGDGRSYAVWCQEQLQQASGEPAVLDEAGVLFVPAVPPAR